MPITVVSAEPIEGKVRREIAIISSLGEHKVGQYVLVRLADEEGRIGLGEASVTAVWSGETQVGCINLIRELLAPLVVGADPFDTEWIMRRLDRAAFANSFAKAALEMALLDLQGKILGIPVCKLLGGRVPPTFLSASTSANTNVGGRLPPTFLSASTTANTNVGGRLPPTFLSASTTADTNVGGTTNGGDPGVRLKFVVGAVEADVAAQRAKRMTDAGWKAIKVKVGRDPKADVERLTAVRRAIGPDVFLSVDANGGYTVEQAVWVAARLEKLEVALFEQPTPRGDHVSMAEVRRRSGIPIMADESVFTPQDVIDVIRAGEADVLSLYPGKHGGIRATQYLARTAESAGIACTIGSNLEREVATAAMAHLAVATGNIQCERFPGNLIGPLYFEAPLTKTPLIYRADRLFVPAEPGLGVTV